MALHFWSFCGKLFNPLRWQVTNQCAYLPQVGINEMKEFAELPWNSSVQLVPEFLLFVYAW
jgi:hypothetical protein